MSSYTIDGIGNPGVTTVLGIKDKGNALIQWAVNCAVDYLEDKLSFHSDVTKQPHEITVIIPKDELTIAKTAWKTQRDNTADIGTTMHDLVEQFVKMKIAEKNTDGLFLKSIAKYQDYNLKQMFYQFYNWQKKHVKRFLRSEQTIVHEEYWYAGTADIVYEDHKGNIWLIDLKTKNALYGGEAEQVAAYMLAMNNMKSREYNVKSRYGEYQVKHEAIRINKCGVLMIARDYFDLQFVDYTDKYKSRLNAFLRLLDFYYADKKRRLKNNPRVKECI
jgi:hypothetical protein